MRKLAIGIAPVLLGVLLNSGIAQSKIVESTITMERQQTGILEGAVAAVVTAVVGAIIGLFGLLATAVITIVGAVGSVLGALGLGAIAVSVFYLFLTAIQFVIEGGVAILGTLFKTLLSSGGIITEGLIIFGIVGLDALASLVVAVIGLVLGVIFLPVLLLLSPITVPCGVIFGLLTVGMLVFCLMVVILSIIAFPVIYGGVNGIVDFLLGGAEAICAVIRGII